MSLREWYANRELLVTGATSDVGRALLEKILRSFPRVKVYAIVRSRPGEDKDERIKNIFLSPRFERLRQEVPDGISRLRAIEGDMSREDLGISEEDKDLLRDTSVVLHAAGPFEWLQRFCQQLPRLRVLAVVSTSIIQPEHGEESPPMSRGPVAVVRVPLAGPALHEPMPGFVDVLTGATALMVGAGLALGRSDLQAAIVPLDLVVNTLLAAAWERGSQRKDDDEGATTCDAVPIGCTWAELIEKGRRGTRTFPYPTFGLRGMTSVVALHWILVLLLEYLPAALFDTVLGLLGAKKRLLKEQRRVRNALRSVESISSKPWSAERNRVYLLQQRLAPDEQDAFPLATEIDVESYVLCASASARKHCVNESNIELMKIFRLLSLSLLVLFLVYGLFFYGRNEAVVQREP